MMTSLGRSQGGKPPFIRQQSNCAFRLGTTKRRWASGHAIIVGGPSNLASETMGTRSDEFDANCLFLRNRDWGRRQADFKVTMVAGNLALRKGKHVPRTSWQPTWHNVCVSEKPGEREYSPVAERIVETNTSGFGLKCHKAQGRGH